MYHEYSTNCQWDKKLSTHKILVCSQCKRPHPIINKEIAPEKVKRRCKIIEDLKRLEKLERKTIFEKLKTLKTEYKKWDSEGKPKRPHSLIIHLYDKICSLCTFFENDSCLLCGCHIKRDRVTLNKLTWATTRCPDIPPRWKEYGEFNSSGCGGCPDAK